MLERLVEPFAENPPDGPAVRGFLHRPEKASGDGLVLTHGAGANCSTNLLVSLAVAFAAQGMHVLRCDLPFRQARPGGPPHPSAAANDREGLRMAVASMRRIVNGRVFLGGHSYGGRQATMLAADPEKSNPPHGLILFSYPLHPPDSPQKKRHRAPAAVTCAVSVHSRHKGSLRHASRDGGSREAGSREDADRLCGRSGSRTAAVASASETHARVRDARVGRVLVVQRIA